MLVLGIESSCDETGVALYDSARGLLAHALHSQINMHRDYGGVVPELASRDHIRRVPLPGAMPSGIDLMDAWCRSVRDAATGDSGALLAS